MKKLFFIMFFLVASSLMYSANVYFYKPNTGDVFELNQSGFATIEYGLYVPNPYFSIDDYRAKLTYPDGHTSEWQYGQVGSWEVIKAGGYSLIGQAHVYQDLSGRYDYWMETSNSVNVSVVDNYAPSVPNNAQVSFPLNSNPVITWIANTERDLSGYRVYKKYTDSYGSVVYNGSTFTVNTSYTDGDFTANYKTGTDVAEYWVTAEDINNNVSGETSHFSGNGTSWYQQKIAYKSDKEIPDIFKIDQNYPNPFNPSTNISYSLPQAGLVNLKIFDLLGNEVAELINEVKEKGNYRVQFNGENLSSGVYIYTVRFKNFIESRRMILMK